MINDFVPQHERCFADSIVGLQDKYVSPLNASTVTNVALTISKLHSNLRTSLPAVLTAPIVISRT